jgi:hypothetical protein
MTDMSANRYKYFKWTPRTARITVVYTMLIPAAILYTAYATEVRFIQRLKCSSTWARDKMARPKMKTKY